MNTPAHSVLALLLIDRGKARGTGLPVLVGSVLPDAPMLLFYLYEKLVAGASERVIWSERYFDVGWQIFFDLFNSLPIIAVLGFIAYRRQAWRSLALLAGMVVHCLSDLPLHREDAHRHFFPLSGWRYESPISYWDPAHFGHYFALFEILGVVVGSVLLWRRYESLSARLLVALTGLIYAGYLGFVVVVWL